MIRTLAKRILGAFLLRYRIPSRPGPIEVWDEISGQHLLMAWRNDSMIETQFFRHGLYGSWERHSLRVWAHLSTDAQEILDIGANTGIYSLLARKNNSSASITALEPVPANANVLQANIQANSSNVIVERAAMSDYDGDAVMYMLKDQLNYMTSVNDNRYALHPEIAGRATVIPITVPVVTWKSLKSKHHLRGPDLIKIDVEGHEVAVMRTLLAHIEEFLPTILLEVIGDENASQINEMLRPFDYAYIAIDEPGGTATMVRALWDNDHQNFLLCRREIAEGLRQKGLIRASSED